MIDDPRGTIEFVDHGSGPTTLVFVPGSFSTGAAWRPVIRALAGRHRIVTTSLLGYGATAERRDARAPSMDTEVEVLRAVLDRVGEPAHVIGHSFGGHVALACAMRSSAGLLSLTVIEPPCPMVLAVAGEAALFDSFRAMSEPYIAAWQAGEADAARRVIDFYGGHGFFDAMPPHAREFTRQSTGANVLDWRVAYADACDRASFGRVTMPTQVLRGALGHPAVQRGNELISQWLPNATLRTVPGASHFMISTHGGEVARLFEAHIAAVSEGLA